MALGLDFEPKIVAFRFAKVAHVTSPAWGLSVLTVPKRERSSLRRGRGLKRKTVVQFLPSPGRTPSDLSQRDRAGQAARSHWER